MVRFGMKRLLQGAVAVAVRMPWAKGLIWVARRAARDGHARAARHCPRLALVCRAFDFSTGGNPFQVVGVGVLAWVFATAPVRAASRGMRIPGQLDVRVAWSQRQD